MTVKTRVTVCDSVCVCVKLFLQKNSAGHVLHGLKVRLPLVRVKVLLNGNSLVLLMHIFMY